MNFAERLNELMALKNIKSIQLGKEIDVGGSTIRYWQRGEKQPSLLSLLKLADYFNCTIDYLTARSENEINFTPKITPPFPQALRRALASQNMTRYSLARDTKFSDSYMYSWDHGAVPDMLTLIELANILDCSIDYLVGRED